MMHQGHGRRMSLILVAAVVWSYSATTIQAMPSGSPAFESAKAEVPEPREALLASGPLLHDGAIGAAADASLRPVLQQLDPRFGVVGAPPTTMPDALQSVG